MRKSFLFLADGFEEVEALGVVDVLRRGTIEVKTVSISDKKEVTGAHGVPVVADLLLSEVEEDAEFLICPGGMQGPRIWEIVRHWYSYFKNTSIRADMWQLFVRLRL